MRKERMKKMKQLLKEKEDPSEKIWKNMYAVIMELFLATNAFWIRRVRIITWIFEVHFIVEDMEVVETITVEEDMEAELLEEKNSGRGGYNHGQQDQGGGQGEDYYNDCGRDHSSGRAAHNNQKNNRNSNVGDANYHYEGQPTQLSYNNNHECGHQWRNVVAWVQEDPAITLTIGEDENGQLEMDSVLKEAFGERLETHWILSYKNNTKEIQNHNKWYNSIFPYLHLHPWASW